MSGGPPSLSSFLSLSEKSRAFANRGKVRQQRNSTDRESRKSFILSSLDKFADDDETLATDLTTGSHSALQNSLNSSMTSTLDVATNHHSCNNNEEAPHRRSRYPRRGSVTKYSLEADEDNSSVCNSSVQSDAILPPSRERICRRGSVTRYSLSEDDDSVSAKSVLTEVCTGNTSKVKESSGGLPPKRLSGSSATKRSSGSMFSLGDHLAKGLSLSSGARSKGSHHDGDHDDASVGCHSVQSDTHLFGRPPLATRTSRTLRTSITKISSTLGTTSLSLGDQLSKIVGVDHFTKKRDDDNASVGGNSIQSDTHLLHRGNRHGEIKRRGGVTRYSLDEESHHSVQEETPREKPRRRGSVTKYSWEGDSVHTVQTEMDKPASASSSSSSSSSRNKPPLVGSSTHSDDRNRTYEVDQQPDGKPRYRRRGSITKFSLDESARTELLGKGSCHSVASTTSALTDDSVDLYGYGDDSDVDRHEMERSAAPRKERVHRRGSVVTYDVPQEAAKNVKSSLSSSSKTTTSKSKVKRTTSSSSTAAKPQRVLPCI
jgi:hypothetical protein